MTPMEIMALIAGASQFIQTAAELVAKLTAENRPQTTDEEFDRLKGKQISVEGDWAEVLAAIRAEAAANKPKGE